MTTEEKAIEFLKKENINNEIISFNQIINKYFVQKSQSLSQLLIKFHNSQPPNLELKCDENFEEVKNPEEHRSDYELETYYPDGEMYNQFDFENFEADLKQHKDAKTFRQRIDELIEFQKQQLNK